MSGESAGLVATEQSGVQDEVVRRPPPRKMEAVKKGDVAARFKSVLKENARVAILTHGVPDPDGIGGIMGIHWLLSKLGIESHGYYFGSISHPQNIALVNLLDPDMRPISEYQKHDIHILVDAIPSNAGMDKLEIPFDVVIDHHKEMPNGNFSGLYINIKAGSTCATVYHLIRSLGFDFEEDNDYDSRVATALMVGIVTDTENLMSDDTTEYEFQAWSSLFAYRNAANLKRIVNYERPKAWIAQESAAINNVKITEGVGVVGLGMLPGKHRDMIADLASQMITWEDVHTAVVFAIVDGERVEGSVRSSNASVAVPQLCKTLGGKFGTGGGKLGKGAYKYDLGGAGIEDEDDDETKSGTWDLVNKREIKRINKILHSE